MISAGIHVGEIISLCFMAIALSMDAFSISLGMGMQAFRLKRIAVIGIVFGLFHIMMPFLGIMLGKVIFSQLGHFAILASGLLLIGIGLQMILSAFNYYFIKVMQPVGIGLFILAFTVSLDSFTVGLSLGMSGVKTTIVLFVFGFFSTCLTWLGMMLGRKVRGVLGAYSEILGGSILMAFGLYILFG